MLLYGTVLDTPVHRYLNQASAALCDSARRSEADKKLESGESEEMKRSSHGRIYR